MAARTNQGEEITQKIVKDCNFRRKIEKKKSDRNLEVE